MPLLTIETKRVSFHFNFGPCSIIFFNYNLELGVIIFGSVFIKKSNQTKMFFKKNQNRTETRQTDRFRFGSVFLGQKRVWLGFLGFGLVFSVWLGFSGLARFFLVSVRFGFSVFCL